jgi:predicted nucleic acid-binding protein
MATTGADPAFVDTNVLVYANQAGAARHDAALAVLRDAEAAGAELWISGQVLREYLAAVTRQQGGLAALPMAIALARVDQFAGQFRLAEDGPPVRARLHALLIAHPTGGRQVHDANNVATMLAHGISRLLTFNLDDFRRFLPAIRIEPEVS